MLTATYGENAVLILKLSIYPPNINVLYKQFAAYLPDLVGYTAVIQSIHPKWGR